MYTYHMSVAMASKRFSFDTCPEMIELIKAAITESNSAFSATRYKRFLTYQGKLDAKHLHIVLKSPEEVSAPTRSLSSLSRAVIAVEKERGTSLLDSCVANGCVFNAVLIDPPTKAFTAEELSDSEVLKAVVDLMYSTDEDHKQKLKELIANYLNEQ